MRDLKTRLACFFVPADQADAALESTLKIDPP
jgi:hypothetical protein